MKLTTRGDRMVLDDTPWGTWMVGALCVLFGLGTLGLPALAGDWSAWRSAQQIQLVLFLGLPFLVAGVLMIALHGATRTTLDRATGEGSHVTRRLGRRDAVTTRFRVADIHAFDLVRSRDEEGDTHVQLRLWLAGSRSLLLHQRPGACSERQANKWIGQVNSFLGVAS